MIVKMKPEIYSYDESKLYVFYLKKNINKKIINEKKERKENELLNRVTIITLSTGSYSDRNIPFSDEGAQLFAVLSLRV